MIDASLEASGMPNFEYSVILTIFFQHSRGMLQKTDECHLRESPIGGVRHAGLLDFTTFDQFSAANWCTAARLANSRRRDLRFSSDSPFEMGHGVCVFVSGTANTGM